jgi:hypothetical protein
MNKNHDWKELNDELRIFTKWFLSGIIDSAFLILWVFVQWGTQRLIANLSLTGIDQWMFLSFQIIFAISTLAPIIIYIYTDIRIMIIKGQRRINYELQDARKYETDKPVE